MLEPTSVPLLAIYLYVLSIKIVSCPYLVRLYIYFCFCSLYFLYRHKHNFFIMYQLASEVIHVYTFVTLCQIFKKKRFIFLKIFKSYQNVNDR